MSSKNFSFHSSFQPQIIYLFEVLKLASENYSGTKEEISDLTGIPTGATSGKVEPHIRYLKYMGMIDFKTGLGKMQLSLTDLGTVVYENDPYLMETASKVIMHYYITHPVKGAPQWSYLFREYNYSLDYEFLVEDINDSGMSKYGMDISITPLKTMYTIGDFSELNLIDINRGKITINSKTVLGEYINIYSYTLLKDWEIYLGNKQEISIDEIFGKILWDKGFNFSYNETLEALDEISARGYIKLNKHMNPITIIKNTSSDKILDSLYEELL